MGSPRGIPIKADIIIDIIMIVIGISVYIWWSRRVSKFEEKKRHMTKRINVVIMKREKKAINFSKDRYIYTFTGLDEYEGVIFYDKSLLLENVHAKGEKVSLLINEENVEEFWFEEENEPPGKGLPVLIIVLSFVALVNMACSVCGRLKAAKKQGCF